MRASTIAAPLAALAAGVSAAPAWTPSTNVTQAWGYWEVSNLTVSNHPSNTAMGFAVKYYGQLTGTHCSGTTQWPQLGPNASYYPCEDSAVAFTVNLDQTQVWLSQKLYQVGAIANLNGSAPLKLNCGFSTAGQECTAEPFRVPVLYESATLPGNITV